MMVMWAAGAVSVAVHDEGCGTGGQADIGLGMGVGELSTGFDAELVLRLPGAIGVDGPAAAHMGGDGAETGALSTSEEMTEMSTKVTPESLRTHAEWLDDRNVSVEIYKVRKAAAVEMHRAADCLEHQQRPLPEKPGWYELIVVERLNEEGEKESCTGAFRDTSGYWHTPDFTVNGASPDVTIRWAEQDGTTPGQTLWEVDEEGAWSATNDVERFLSESRAAAVLAVHGTSTLTFVGEHPKPGTRGLLPVEVGTGGDGWLYNLGKNYLCTVGSRLSERILADPRPDGAQ